MPLKMNLHGPFDALQFHILQPARPSVCNAILYLGKRRAWKKASFLERFWSVLSVESVEHRWAEILYRKIVIILEVTVTSGAGTFISAYFLGFFGSTKNQ